MIDIAKERKKIRSRMPLLGATIRRRAARRLAAESTAQTIPLLIETLADEDEIVRQIASKALGSLKLSEAVDTFCDRWAKGRDAALEAILVEKGYTAAKPVALRVLSALKAGRLEIAGESAAAVTECIALLKDKDGTVAKNADTTLRQLSKAEAIDALCAAWEPTRNAQLGELVAACGYVAREPLELRVLSALQTGKADLAWETPKALDYLVSCLGHKQPETRQAAEKALRQIADPEAVERLCTMATAQPESPIAKICIETGKRPADDERLALFLVVTRQLDEYEKADHEFQFLHPAYERAAAEVREHVMQVYRSGDRRLAGFIGAVSKPLSKCSDHEIRMHLETKTRHKQWPELFRAIRELPLVHGYPYLKVLADSGWAPEAPESLALFRRLVAETGDTPLPENAGAQSPVFERWLSEGRDRERGSEADLLRRLETATPPEGVKIVAALARDRAGDAARGKIAASPHWLVRMAGYATGLIDLQAAEQDANFWCREVAGGQPLLIWPRKATPDDLERLESAKKAPREGTVGRLAAARRILTLLIRDWLAPTVIQEEELEIMYEAAVVEDAD